MTTPIDSVVLYGYGVMGRGIGNTFAAAGLAATRMLGPRMCVSGLVLQKDISGLKVNRDAQRAIVPHLFHNREPNALPGELFGRGETGLAAGKGFYDWAGLDAAEVRKVAARELQKLIAFLDEQTFKHAARVQPKPRALKS